MIVVTRATEDEDALVAALKGGDESAFAALVDRHAPGMLRVARGYVPSREIAEEVVQETWIALLKGIDSFEGRSSLRTWLFTVLINIAKRRGVRERRDADVAVMAYTGGTVDPARFRGTDDPYPGHWRQDEVAVAVSGYARGVGARGRADRLGAPGTRQATRPAACRGDHARHAGAGLRRGAPNCWRSAWRINAFYCTRGRAAVNRPSRTI